MALCFDNRHKRDCFSVKNSQFSQTDGLAMYFSTSNTDNQDG